MPRTKRQSPAVRLKQRRRCMQRSRRELDVSHPSEAQLSVCSLQPDSLTCIPTEPDETDTVLMHQESFSGLMPNSVLSRELEIIVLDYVSRLLKVQFNCCHGLLPLSYIYGLLHSNEVLPQAHLIPSQTDAVQMHYVEHHYVVSQQTGSEILVWDSLPNENRLAQILPQLKLVYACMRDNPDTKVSYVVAQHQGQTVDCGVFAIYNTYLLLDNTLPNAVSLNQPELRQSLFQSLQRGFIDPPPLLPASMERSCYNRLDQYFSYQLNQHKNHLDQYKTKQKNIPMTREGVSRQKPRKDMKKTEQRETRKCTLQVRRKDNEEKVKKQSKKEIKVYKPAHITADKKREFNRTLQAKPRELMKQDMERKAYYRLKKAAQREQKKQEDKITYSASRAEEKSNHRKRKRSEDLIKFNKHIATEKSTQRERKRTEDKAKFDKHRATEQSMQRERKRTEDKTKFNKHRATEKSTQRETKRTEDKAKFDKHRATEQSVQREMKRTEDKAKFNKHRATEKSMQRERKRTEDKTKFNKLRATEKSTQRERKRTEDKTKFNKLRATEKSAQRERKHTEDKTKFNKLRATEKSAQRERKRTEDKTKFNKLRATEKSAQRERKCTEDKTKFNKLRAMEKSEGRQRKKRLDEAEYRRITAEEKSRQREMNQKDSEQRINAFLESIKHGRIFECMCCHRRLFANGVIKIPDENLFQVELEKRTQGLFNDAIGNIQTRKSPDEKNGTYHICISCNGYLNKGKVPPMSNKNSLGLFNTSNYPELNLTEVENSLIALNLIFQKIYQLPKSRWPAMKDKTINIPIYESDVVQTVESLPRTPSDAHILPVKLKRKLEYKNVHKVEYVSVEKVLTALSTLKQLGNRYYKFVQQTQDFQSKCREDLENSERCEETELANPGKMEYLEEIQTSCTDLNNIQNTSKENNTTETQEMRITQDTADNSVDSDPEEEEYVTKDPVRKWQFEYNKSSCFTNNYPEINYTDDNSNMHEVAPGEGKTSSNILQETDWDIKSFPCLHPDGKNGLHENRKIKLSDQYYFIQRITNKDRRFANSPAFVFAATAFLEKQQMQRNIGISFIRGKSQNAGDSCSTYSLDDPCSVLDNIKNTPRYWQKAKYELFARLENLGPFTFFFTLSCGDMRWPENFSSLLDGHTISYTRETCGKQLCLVDGLPLEDFLKLHESKHAFIKKNLLNATLTFHHRVKMFIQKIIMSKGNQMSINYYSYKTEFAFRGAPHIHGVLWVDWDKCKVLPNEIIIEDGKEVNVDHMSRIKVTLDAIKNDRYDTDVERDLRSVERFTDEFITCTLMDPKTANTIQEVNCHHHTRACRKYGSQCRFSFPKYPSLKTVVSIPGRLLFKDKDPVVQKQETKALEAILNKVKVVLEDEEKMADILDIHAKDIEEYMDGNRTTDQLMFYKKNRLEKLLEVAGIEVDSSGERIPKYQQALKLSKGGFSIVHERDVAETMVNNYNKEWISAWNANLDIQLCLDYFAVITYISDYYGKDDSGTLKFIKEALKTVKSNNRSDKLKAVVSQFLTHRQIGESEAYYRILPSLHLKSANSECRFVPLGFKENRSTFLDRLDESATNTTEDIIKIKDREGCYIEKPSLISKYIRRDCSQNEDLKNLCYAQFAQRYVASRNGPKQNDHDINNGTCVPKSDVNYDCEDCDQMGEIIPNELITDTSSQPYAKKIPLPKFIRLLDLMPGEPPFMRLRSPFMIRFHKINRSKNPQEYIFSQLQLYRPFLKEEDLQPEISEPDILNKLNNVKSLLMPHLEGVEEGTQQCLLHSNAAGQTLNAANEQDNDDCEHEGLSEHPDYLSKHPQDFFDKPESNKGDNVYKRIELSDLETVDKMTLRLDDEQSKVLNIGVNFAKNLVKSLKIRNSQTTAPLIIVQGGAGSGKSAVIEVLSQRMELILRKRGDNPYHPYIVKTAFTGTAAANIEGQTMTSAFAFPFGNDFYSLTDKSRDEKRTLLQNLAVVIIDEFSMIKADMLYQLDLRLREVKQRPDVPFGGVAIFFFGDILQLRPVRARYIFEEPQSENYHLTFIVDPLWNKMEVICLLKNHRQEEDKTYADLLNRVRTGDQTKEDLDLLRTRVRPEGHPDLEGDALIVTCLNKDVNQINERKLAEINRQEHVIEAVTISRTQKNMKPQVDAAGAVKNTQLQKTLKLKIGAKVMVTVNVNTADCLTNGTFGEIVDFEKDTEGSICTVLVNFTEEKCGRELRKKRPDLQRTYPLKKVTPIKKIEQDFSLSRKPTSASTTATAIQFPLRLAFAATSHKVQGMTIKKPNSLIINLQARCQAAQAYVMLSRVQELQQLFILGCLPAEKLFPSTEALVELERMQTVNINKTTDKRTLLSSLNIRSQEKNFIHLLKNVDIRTAEVICLQETWIKPGDAVGTFVMDGFTSHFNNRGRGTGIVTYFPEEFTFSMDIKHARYQMTKIISEHLEIINVYRSSDAPATFLNDLQTLLNPAKLTYIAGDFNICYLTNKHHKVIQHLEACGFRQLVTSATHTEGHLLDHFYSNSPTDDIKVKQEALYFSDHDVLLAKVINP